jgi:hypothetical protein
MTVLRVYDPPECDERGVPLDWERCRSSNMMLGGGPACPACDGHGSLNAAALAALMTKCRTCHHEAAAHVQGVEHGLCAECDCWGYEARGPARCEDCGHPMSEGTWEGGDERAYQDIVEARHTVAGRYLRRGDEPPNLLPVHFSPCDEGCRHGGPGRFDGDPEGPTVWVPLDDVSGTGDARPMVHYGVEASWRQVDVRTLGWPHDLRPEKLAVLCLRCWAGR